MSIDRKFIAKNGIQTQNIDFVTIDRTGTIQVSMLDGNILSFSGTSGQLFSVTDSMTGTIFAVNDISGVPSIEVDDTGVIRFAETFGNVLIGTATDNGTNKLQVNGSVLLTATNINSLANTTAITYTTASTSQVAIDTFATTSYRSAKYFVQMTSGTAYHVTELNIVHNGTTPYLVEYGENKTGSSLGTFDASIAGSTLSLLFTPVNAATTVKMHRTTIVI